MTVLHIPAVVSPQTAVQVVIVQEYKSRDRGKENEEGAGTAKLRLPKGEAKGKIGPVRFSPEDIRRIEARARSSKQTAEWMGGRS